MNRGRESDVIKHIGIIFLLIGLAGCLGGTRPAPLVKQYILEYPPPRVENIAPANAILRVERFSVNRDYLGPEMVFVSGPFQRGIYHEHRWRVSPADMVADFLRRDLRTAALFRAVLAPRDTEEPRYLLAGGVEEFVEAGEGTGRKASLVATVTLLDLRPGETPGRVVFQKTYRSEATVAQKGAAGFAEGMSQAMSRFSTEVITDIARALKK